MEVWVEEQFKMTRRLCCFLASLIIILPLFPLLSIQLVPINDVRSESGQVVLQTYGFIGINTTYLTTKHVISWEFSLPYSECYVDVLITNSEDFPSWVKLITEPTFYTTGIDIETLALHIANSGSGIFLVEKAQEYVIIFFFSDPSENSVIIDYSVDHYIPPPDLSWLYKLLGILAFLGLAIGGYFTYRHRKKKRIKNLASFPAQKDDRSFLPVESKPEELICPNCFSSIPPDEYKCLSCGRNVRCYICSQPINNSVAVLSCPHCDAAGHRDHMRAYVGTSRRCPKCFQNLAIGDLLQMNFES